MSADYILAVPPMRYVLVHYHIFKNGGSTIESIFSREFGDSFARLHGPTPNSVLDKRYLTAFLRANPAVSAVSSHHLRYPVPKLPNTVIFDCCFFRHPLARLQSLYGYLRNLDCSSDPLCSLAHEESPKAFLRMLADHAPHVVSNVQVTQLANQGAFTRPANRCDLDRALRIIPFMSMPGLVEEYDESLAIAEFYLRPAFPSMALHYVAQNVTRPAQWNGLEPQDYLPGLWGTEVYETLVNLNQLDLELFQGVRDEIAVRRRQIPRFAERLAEFRSRCSHPLTIQPEGRESAELSLTAIRRP